MSEWKLNAIIRKQWNEAASSWIGFVRSGKDYYREYMNGPALEKMVSNVEGKKVLDIGCGEGYFSRFFAGKGAEVTGVDMSEVIINTALDEERKHPLGVKYFVTDAANLEMLNSGSFDVAFCYMALMDIADYEGVIKEASRILKPHGRFVILITHPCFEVRTIDGKRVMDW